MNAYQAGMKLLCGSYSEYTPTGKSNFVKAGRWYKVPEKGDYVYYYSDSMGRVCHVGIVVEVNRKNHTFSFFAVEGNTSGIAYERNGGCVAQKTYLDISYDNVGGSNRINGFGRPMFGDDTCTPDDLIAVVKGEIGYIEHATPDQEDDPKANPGSNNFTKYGRWYGDDGVYWCQEFGSWCGYHACVIAYARKEHTEKWEQQEDGRWMYRMADGGYATGWQYINGRWYAFDDAGTMIKGWFISEDTWYVLGEDGGMLSSQWYDYSKDGSTNQYYLTSTGAMATNTYVKDTRTNMYYWIDKDGIYEKQWDTPTPDLEKYEVAV